MSSPFCRFAEKYAPSRCQSISAVTLPLRLRGWRSCADSARGTRPSGLPSIACGRDGGGFVPVFYAQFFECKTGKKHRRAQGFLVHSHENFFPVKKGTKKKVFSGILRNNRIGYYYQVRRRVP